MRTAAVILVCCLSFASAPGTASAWGASGHRMINGAAARGLPADLPAFLRAASAHDEIAILGVEADRVRGSGQPLDGDDDPAHFVNVQDDLTIGGLPLSGLPANRHAYDARLRTGTPPADQYAAGYLPYQIADNWERIVRDLGYWRVDVVGEQKGATAEDRAFFALDRRVREAVTLRDIGYWGHFVADGSQPLHASVHYNGWNSTRDDNFPNPNGYSNSHTIHSRFESALVRSVGTEDLVFAHMPPMQRGSTAPILARVGAYLSATAAGVPRVYELEQAGGIDGRSAEATSFVLDRLGAGAAQLRDLIASAWDVSADAKVGYPAVSVHDLEAGTIVPTRSLVGFGD